MNTLNLHTRKNDFEKVNNDVTLKYKIRKNIYDNLTFCFMEIHFYYYLFCNLYYIFYFYLLLLLFL